MACAGEGCSYCKSSDFVKREAVKLFMGDRAHPATCLPLTACVFNEANLGLGSLLGINGSLLAHGSEDDDV